MLQDALRMPGCFAKKMSATKKREAMSFSEPLTSRSSLRTMDYPSDDDDDEADVLAAQIAEAEEEAEEERRRERREEEEEEEEKAEGGKALVLEEAEVVVGSVAAEVEVAVENRSGGRGDILEEIFRDDSDSNIDLSEEDNNSVPPFSGVTAVDCGDPAVAQCELDLRAKLSEGGDKFTRDQVRSSPPVPWRADAFGDVAVFQHSAGELTVPRQLIGRNYVVHMPRGRGRRTSAPSCGVVIALFSSPSIDDNKLRALLLQLGPDGAVLVPNLWDTMRVLPDTVKTLGVTLDVERNEAVVKATVGMAGAVLAKHSADFKRATPEK
jgi:hypothetical protein